MARNWEDDLRKWVQRPSDNEDEKRKTTEKQIRDALRASPALKAFTYRVYAKGSYANTTNVRLDYDIDIAVERIDSYFYSITGKAASSKKAKVEQILSKHVDPTVADFKAAVEKALVTAFGRAAVTPGKIAFRIPKGKTRVPADVVPCFEYRQIYDLNWLDQPKVWKGTRVVPSSGKAVNNWPEQQLARGIEKNDATGRRYKRMVRALKKLQGELIRDGRLTEKEGLPSFLIECLVYNVPNDKFRTKGYVADMRAVLATIFNATLSDVGCKDWLEPSERKYLFRPSQPWTYKQAHALARAAWDYMGFE